MDPHSSFAQRLNLLFEATPGPRDGLWTNAEVVRAMAKHGVSITPTYLGSLRSGERRNPSWKIVDGLAKTFGVSVTYFSPTDDTSPDLLESLKARGVTEVAFRAASLGLEAQRKLLDFVDLLRAAEGSIQHRDHTSEDG